MRHGNGYRKLGRTTAHRLAMLRNMAIALLRDERIEVTTPKAKTLRPYVEKLITLGKRGDLAARRLAAEAVHDHAVLQKLFGEIGPRMADRNGGYTRIIGKGVRHGDNADVSLIELVDRKSA